MDISEIPDRVWKNILKEEANHDFESLSLKILLARLRMKLRLNPNELDESIADIKQLFNSQGNLPSLQRDIQKIKVKGGIL